MTATFDDGDVYTLEQKLDIVWKRIYNVPSTDEDKEFYQEDLSLMNRDFIIPMNQIWADDIPDTAPSFQFTDAEALGVTNPIPGVTTPVDYSHVVKYQQLEMEVVGGSNDQSYFLSELIDSIPFTYDSAGSYNGILYRNDASTEIPFGKNGGSWHIDHSSGVLTFFNYSSVSSFVDADNPPVMTFFRYEGVKGLQTGVTSAPTTSIEVFNGGDSSGSADTLSSLIVDDRNVGSFSQGTLSRSLNFGGYNEGSWRICVESDGASFPENSRLVFQKRTDTAGVWDTKHTLQ